jgi:signal transduction histidine kinase
MLSSYLCPVSHPHKQRQMTNVPPYDKRSKPQGIACAVLHVWLLLYALFGVFLPSAWAQHQDEVRFLGLNEGLSSRRVTAIVQDKRGKMWIGTDNGLNTFDGSRFHLFSGVPAGSLHLPSPVIWRLEEDASENLWIITSEGSVALNPARNRILPLSELGVPDSLSRQPNFNIALHHLGGFWMLAGQYVYHYRKTAKGVHLEKTGRHPFKADSQPQFAASARGQLWLFSEKQGLAIWDDKTFQIVDCTRLRPPGISPDDERVIPASKKLTNVLGDSITFYFTASRMLIEIDEVSKTIAAFRIATLDHTLPQWQSVLRYLVAYPKSFGESIGLENIYKDQRGAWWFATNMGIFLVKSENDYPFRQFDFLEGRSIRSIFQDDQGDFRVGTYNGLYTFRNGRQPTILTNPTGVVWSILPIEKDLFWVGRESPNGLAQYRRLPNGTFKIQEFSYTFVYDMARFQNTFWIGGEGPAPVLHCLDISSGRLLQKIPLMTTPPDGREPYVKKILVSSDSTLWAAGDAGLFMLRRRPNGAYLQDNQSLPEILRSLQINDLYEDGRGNIWIASKTQGLVRFHPKTLELNWYKEKDGLTHNTTYSILSSHSDSLLWIGTQKGLNCFQTFTGTFTNFYEKDGLAHDEFNTAAAFRATNGDLYFGGLNGITWFRPEMPRATENLPRAYIVMEVLHLKSGSRRQIIPQTTDTITLRPLEKYMDFQLFSNELSESSNVKFRFSLSEVFDFWQNTNAGEKIIVTTLPPGRHKLFVQAKLPDGNWGPYFSLSLRVLPPWYRTWWFITLITLTALLTAYGVFRLRIRHVEREYELRKQVSDDLHDDLGSRLFALRNMAQKMAAPLAENPEMSRLSDQFSTMSRDALHTVRNFIWAFDPKNDRIQDLASRMEDFADSVILPLVPNLEFQSQNLYSDKKISPMVKHHALLAFQEILINMIKHTRPAGISITVDAETRELLIFIKNRYEQTSEMPDAPGGYGTESIAARLRAANGNIEWTEGENTQEARISIPL